MRKSNKILSFLALLAIAFSFSAQAKAADLRTEKNSGDKNAVFTIDASETVRNLYAFGRQLVVNANPSKDTVAAGANVTINGNTTDDLIAAGAMVNVFGNTGGTARIAGATVNVNGTVGDDLVIAGSNVTVDRNSAVAHDLLATGSAISLQAPVHGNVTVTARSLYINSTVDGSVNFRGSKLQLGPDANIKGDVTYSSPSTYERDANAQVGGSITYHQIQNERNFGTGFKTFLAVGFLIKLIAFILAGLVLVWLLKPRYEAVTMATLNGFWKNVGWGLIFFIVTPIVALILVFTLVGFYIALLLFLTWLLALFYAGLIGATVFGFAALRWMNRRQMPVFRAGSVALAIFVSVVLAQIPILGALFALILILAGLGGIFKHFRAAV